MRTFLDLTHFKLSLLLTLLLAVRSVYSVYDVMNDCSDDSWKLYKLQFQKQYRSSVEDARRRVIFCNNIHMIYDHNERYKRGEVTFEMGVNQFTDMTSDEFRRWLHGGSIGAAEGLAGGSMSATSFMRIRPFY